MRSVAIETRLGYAAELAREVPEPLGTPRRDLGKAVDVVVKALETLNHESRARVLRAAAIVVGLE